MLEVTAVPAFQDNYIWLIHGMTDRGRVAVVDPGDAAPVLSALNRRPRHPSPPRSHRWYCCNYRRASGTGLRPSWRTNRGRRTSPRRGRYLPSGHAGTEFSGSRRARPHRRTYRLCGSRRGFLRRHPLRRMRPVVRGHSGRNEPVAGQAFQVARRHTGLLRARIHAGKSALCASGRTGQRRSRCICPASREGPRSGHSDCAEHDCHRACYQSFHALPAPGGSCRCGAEMWPDSRQRSRGFRHDPAVERQFLINKSIADGKR